MIKYNISICLLIKDENKYLREWIDWHNSIGVDHYYIYDNGSSIPVKDTALEYFPENLFTFIEWNDLYDHIQIEAYNHCLENYGSESKWIAFIDTDEFIHPESGKLNLDKYVLDYPYVISKWKIFNANGHLNYSPEDVQKRFTQVYKYTSSMSHKSFVQPSKVNGMLIHNADLPNYEPLVLNDVVIHHYFTRSLEEWKEKIIRGTCSNDCHRKYNEFFFFNLDLVDYREDVFMFKEQKYQ